MESETCVSARGVLLDSEQPSSVSVSDMVGGKIIGMERLVVGPLGSGKRCEIEEGMVKEEFGIIISKYFSETLDLAGEKIDIMELEK